MTRNLSFLNPNLLKKTGLFDYIVNLLPKQQNHTKPTPQKLMNLVGYFYKILHRNRQFKDNYIPTNFMAISI